jgi:uncharacterized membrane protein YkvA (DUF1232 family)
MVRGFRRASVDRSSDKTKSSRRSGGASARRFVGLLALLPLAGRTPLYARLIWALVLDDRVAVSRKAVLLGAFGYVFLGRDVIPDEIPIVGGLDDLVVVAIAVDVFLDAVDETVLHEKLIELGIPRAAFDEDMARIRKLLPGPIRRTIRRLPNALEAAGSAVQQAGLGSRLRGWIDREGSPA